MSSTGIAGDVGVGRYVVIFTSLRTAGDDGVGITVSYWRDEEGVRVRGRRNSSRDAERIDPLALEVEAA